MGKQTQKAQCAIEEKELLVSVYLTQVKLCSAANDMWSYSVDVRVQGLIFPELRRDCYPGERSRGGVKEFQ